LLILIVPDMVISGLNRICAFILFDFIHQRSFIEYGSKPPKGAVINNYGT